MSRATTKGVKRNLGNHVSKFSSTPDMPGTKIMKFVKHPFFGTQEIILKDDESLLDYLEDTGQLEDFLAWYKKYHVMLTKDKRQRFFIRFDF